MEPVAALIAIRCSARLTQQQLADLLGVDRSVYNMYESGKLPLSPRQLERICDKCAVPPDARKLLEAQIIE